MEGNLDTTFQGHGLGALLRVPSWKDYQIERAPGIAPFLGQAPDTDDHLLAFIKGTYDQLALPSCVAHSFAGLSSIYEYMEHGQWVVMDAVRCYYDNGGDGHNGIYSQAVLKYAQIQGIPALTGGARYKIDSYAFASPFDPNGIVAVKTALWQGHPCKLAMALPSDMMNGMTAGLTAPNRAAYHEVIAVAYTPERVIFKNSWGESYGQGGLGSVPWAFLQHPLQQGYSYFYTTMDARDEGRTPLPPVPPLPPIPPVPLTVTGYQGATAQVPQFPGEGQLTINGTGLDGEPVQVWFGSSLLGTSLRSPTSVLVKLPKVEVPTTGRIKVARGTVSASGPLLVVAPNGTPQPQPEPDPDPDPDLTLRLSTHKYTGSQNTYGIAASVIDSGGKMPGATYTGTVGSQLLLAQTRPANFAATWQVNAAAGSILTVQATTTDGRSVRASKPLTSG